MELRAVGQVSLAAKSIKIIVNLDQIDSNSTMGGIATFHVNLEHLRRLIDGKNRVATISQLVRRQTALSELPPAYSVEQIRREYPKAYMKWTKEEDECLARLYRDGKTVSQLAGIFQRQPGAIRSRLHHLGLGQVTTPSQVGTRGGK